MSPRLCPGDVYPLRTGIHPREGAVITLLFPRDDQLDFFLTRRRVTLGTHKGQTALPGGAQEVGESIEQTAFCKAVEELGIDPQSVRVIDGPLTPVYVPVCGFRVTRFVGYCTTRPEIA